VSAEMVLHCKDSRGATAEGSVLFRLAVTMAGSLLFELYEGC